MPKKTQPGQLVHGAKDWERAKRRAALKEEEKRGRPLSEKQNTLNMRKSNEELEVFQQYCRCNCLDYLVDKRT